MTVKDVMTLLESPDRVRVIKDGDRRKHWTILSEICSCVYTTQSRYSGEVRT